MNEIDLESLSDRELVSWVGCEPMNPPYGRWFFAVETRFRQLQIPDPVIHCRHLRGAMSLHPNRMLIFDIYGALHDSYVLMVDGNYLYNRLKNLFVHEQDIEPPAGA